MRTFLKTLLFIFVVFSFSSCSTYWQVAHINTDDHNIKQVEGYYTTETSELEIKYDFWSEYGKVEILVENKTDRNIVIDMGESYYIKNGRAKAYSTEGTSLMVVPAHCWDVLCRFDVTDFMYRDCKLYLYEFGAKSSSEESFTKETTPLVFENRLVYRFEYDQEIHNLNNEFYIDHIANMNDYKFRTTKWVNKFCVKEGDNGLSERRQIAIKKKIGRLEASRRDYELWHDDYMVKELSRKIEKYQDQLDAGIDININSRKGMEKKTIYLQEGKDKYYIKYTTMTYGRKTMH